MSWRPHISVNPKYVEWCEETKRWELKKCVCPSCGATFPLAARVRGNLCEPCRLNAKRRERIRRAYEKKKRRRKRTEDKPQEEVADYIWNVVDY